MPTESHDNAKVSGAVSGPIKGTPAEAVDAPAAETEAPMGRAPRTISGEAAAAVFDAAADRLASEAPDGVARNGVRNSRFMHRLRELIVEEADIRHGLAGPATGATVDQLQTRGVGQVSANSPSV